MLTPQAIKDQEFQVKFRGYDAIEVKAYLELLAEDYFELTEKTRTSEEEIASLKEEIEALTREKSSLEDEIASHADSLSSSLSEQGLEEARLTAEVDELQEKLGLAIEEKEAAENTTADCKKEIAAFRQKAKEAEDERGRHQGEIDKLMAKIDILEERNNELKQEGADFKTTILAAQNFANNLRETTEEKAQAMMEEAVAEVEKFKSEAKEELDRLPKEIEALERRKNTVRAELKELLEKYLEGLDHFESGPGSGEDLSQP